MDKDSRRELLRKDEIAQEVAKLSLTNPSRMGLITKNLDALSSLEEKAREKNCFKVDGQTEGETAAFLENAGILEIWGSRDSTYLTYMSDDVEGIEYAREIFEEFNSYGWSQRETWATLKVLSEEILEKDVTSRDLDRKYVPNSRTVKARYNGSWKSALYFAGMPAEESPEKAGELANTDIRDSIRRKTYELGRIPECKEVYNDPRMPNQDQITGSDEFENYTDLINQEFPYRTTKNENGRNKDIKQEGLEKGKWSPFTEDHREPAISD